MTVYKQISYKNSSEGEVIEVAISAKGMENNNLYGLKAVEIYELDNDEKNMLLENIVNILQALTSVYEACDE